MDNLELIDLENEYYTRLNKTKQFEKEVSCLEKQLHESKSKHAKAMQEYIKLSIYKDRAKYQHRNLFFEWFGSDSDQWSKGRQARMVTWEYETPTMKFNLKIKEREDLKVWKYEVYIVATKVYFESFEMIRMYDRINMTGWRMGNANFLENHYNEEDLVQKFKTFEQALIHLDKWKKKLKSEFSSQIRHDKDLYNQACKKYDHAVRIQLNYSCSKLFYNEIKKYNLEIVRNRDWIVELSGLNAKDIVNTIKEKYNMDFEILAG